jgi:hypothetical protein
MIAEDVRPEEELFTLYMRVKMPGRQVPRVSDSVEQLIWLGTLDTSFPIMRDDKSPSIGSIAAAAHVGEALRLTEMREEHGRRLKGAGFPYSR